MKPSSVRSIAGFDVFFGAWQFLAGIGWINPVLLPSPLQLDQQRIGVRPQPKMQPKIEREISDE